MPTPKCASGEPMAERGRLTKRRQASRQRHAAEAYAPGEIGHGAGHDEDAERDAERRQPGTALIHGQRQHHDDDGQHGREHQPLRGAQHVAALPGEERPERQRQQQRHHQRPERPIEVRRADGDLVAGQRFEQQRIERADQHGGARRRQQDVVEDEGAFAADGREDAALAQIARAPGEQRQAAAGEQRHDGEDENAALRIDGEGVHRGEHARAHEEGAHQRQREGEDGEQHRPHLQRVALLHDERRVQQRRAGEPGHERGVLDRIPEPPAAPAELVVGPPRAHGDADGQAHPGGERPRPHPARPGGVDAPFDQRGDGEREGDREADVARVEKRRMKGERRVLQDRIEAAAVGGRRVHAQERIRRQQDEQQEGDGDRRLHGEHVGLEGQRQVAAEGGDGGAEQRQDHHPQHHRAFVVPPHAGDAIEQRLGRVRVGDDVGDGEVGRHVGVRQRQEGKSDEAELAERGGIGHGHHARVAYARAPRRHDHLEDGDEERQDQREMPQLDDHLRRLRGMRRALAELHAFRLERLGDLRRHVVLIVLGEHAVGDEGALGRELALGDDALSFLEQVRQHALVGDRHRLQRIGDGELDLGAAAALHRALGDEAAETEALAAGDRLFGKIAGRVEEDDRIAQGEQHEADGQREHRHADADQNATPLLSRHAASFARRLMSRAPSFPPERSARPAISRRP